MLVIAPLLINVVIRTYGWKVILANGNAGLLKSFKPVKSGMVEFDLLAKKPGSEIKVALHDEAQKEVAALIVDKDGAFFTEIGGDRKKIDDTINYRHGWNLTAR